MYLIRNLCPRTDISMGCHAFGIELSREWPAMVEASGIDQSRVDKLIRSYGAKWLDSCGYGQMFDPDNCGFNRDKNAPLGSRARRSYEPDMAIRVSWGKWGPEHITVPGNACGLDIDDHAFGMILSGGRMLNPHNIDCWNQKNLLLIVFTEIAESVVLFSTVDKKAESAVAE